jgi:16S rRNA processing protein RimM
MGQSVLKRDLLQPSSDEFVVLGRIGAPFGVRGLIHVHSFTEPFTRLMDYKTWHLKKEKEKNWQAYILESVREHGKGLVAKLEGITDRDDAARLTNLDIGILRRDLPELPAGDFYWVDLIGLRVLNEQGTYLGKVEQIFETGANDILVVKGETKEHLIPYIPGDYVVQVDLKLGSISVHWDPEF